MPNPHTTPAAPAPVTFDFDEIMEAGESGEYVGICRACGAWHDGVEPDARRYRCDECDALQVYGAEELVLMLC